MKKDRNSFFAEYGAFNNMQQGMMIPNQMASANSNFYMGPAGNLNNNMYSDIDTRLSKIERQLNRLENRVSHLEGDSSTDDLNYSNNSMYMV